MIEIKFEKYMITYDVTNISAVCLYYMLNKKLNLFNRIELHVQHKNKQKTRKNTSKY